MKTARSAYRSPLREEQAGATRERILRALEALTERGEETTYAALAQESGVQERTVYRHFPARDELLTAFWHFMHERVGGDGFQAKSEAELLEAVKSSFRGFDARSNVVRAMLSSEQGLAIRLADNAARQAMFLRCVDAACPGLDRVTRRRAAAAVQTLYSAGSWDSLHHYWGLDGKEAAEVVTLAIASVFAGLRGRRRTADKAAPNPTRKSAR